MKSSKTKFVNCQSVFFKVAFNSAQDSFDFFCSLIQRKISVFYPHISDKYFLVLRNKQQFLAVKFNRQNFVIETGVFSVKFEPTY